MGTSVRRSRNDPWSSWRHKLYIHSVHKHNKGIAAQEKKKGDGKSVDLTKCCCHCMVFNSWLAISRRQVGTCVIPAFVIVVLYVQTGELGKTDAQCAACIVDVLSIQSLGNDRYVHFYNSIFA